MTSRHLLDSVLSDQLEQVDRRIEQCLKEIKQLLQTLPQEKKNEEKKKPIRKNSFTLDTNYSLHTTLEKMNAFFQAHPGHENGLLNHLGEIRKQMGLSMISSSSEALEYVTRSASIVSTNQAEKQSNQFSSNILWEIICHVAEKYVFQNLISMSLSSGRHFEICHYTWCTHLNALRQIRTPVSVWELTQKVRKWQIDEFKCSCPAYSNAGADVGGSNFYWKTCFHCLLDISFQCIKEDQEFVSVGCFLPLIVTWTELCKPYVERISNYFQDLLDVLSKDNETAYSDSEKAMVYCLNCRKSCTGSCDKNVSSFSSCPYADSEERIPADVEEDKQSRCTIHEQSHLAYKRSIINILLGMIESVYVFEKQLIYVSCGITSRMPVLPCENCCTSVFNGISLAMPFDSPEQSPLHHSPNEYQDSYFICAWDWRSSVVSNGFLNFLQRSLQESIQVATQTLIKEEWNAFISTTKLPICKMTRAVPKTINPVKYCILESVAYVIEEIDKFVPVIAAAQGAFQPFLASFSHTIHTYLLDLLNHIEKMAAQVPTNSTVDCLYILLNSVDYLKGTLQVCNGVLNPKDGAEQPDSSLYLVTMNLTELLETLNKRIYLYHTKMLKGSILLDAESLDWKNPKPFYEGERISFSIQMWYLYMKKMIFDLKRNLSQDLAQSIFTSALFESVKYLCMQYSRAFPSKNRVEQFKSDIVAILFVVSELLFTVCTSVPVLMGVDNLICTENTEVSSIEGVHSICSTLLILMAIHSSPLPTLYKVFKKGLPSFTSQIPLSMLTCAPWLPWIHPSLFSCFRENAVMSSISVWHIVKLCASQIEPNPLLIVKAYTSYNCTLSILLMSQACNIEDLNSSELHQLVSAIFTVFVYSHYKDGLATVLLPVIDRCNGWNEFDASNFERLPQERPWWYCGLINLIQPTLDKVILSQLPKMWHQGTTELIHPVSSDWQELKMKLLSTIQCNCHPSLHEWPRDLQTLANVNALEMLSCLADHIPTIPVNIITSLSVLGKHMAEFFSNVKPCGDSLGLQVLLSGLVMCIKDTAYIQNLVTETLNDEMNQLCSQTADVLKGFVIFESSEKSILKEYHESAQKFVRYITKTFRSVRIPINNEPCKNEPDKEYVDQGHLQVTISEILQDPKGPSSLLHLYHLLRSNLHWIKISLGVPSLFPGDDLAERIDLGLELPEFAGVENDFNRTFTVKNDKGSFILDTKKPDKKSDTDNRKSNKNDESQELIENEDNDFDSGKSMTVSINEENEEDDTLLKDKRSSISSHQDSNQIEDTVEQKENVDRENSLKLGGMNESLTHSDACFNPLNAFEQCNGENIFDQQLLASFPFHWDKLLAQTPLLGLSEVGFKTLLSHRWEFQGLDSLPEGHEKYVETLKNMYGLESNDSLP